MIRCLLTLCTLLLSFTAAAQPWPARPVKIIAPFAPGGSADTLGRIVAKNLTEQLKETFVVENRPGGGGVLGSDLVAKAAPDGYTLVVSGIASHVIAPQLPQGTPYDPLKDFTHVALLGGPPAELPRYPQLPAQNPPEVVALAMAKPLSYGSPGNGHQDPPGWRRFQPKTVPDPAHDPH